MQRCLSTVETVEKGLTRSSQAKGQASPETQMRSRKLCISVYLFFFFFTEV